jgi:hypothetical protein
MQRPRLLTALVYLKVRHPVKRWYDAWYPLIAAIVVTVLYGATASRGIKVDIFGENGLVQSANGISGILVGFFIAALAAVSTFPGKDMDSVMPGNAPTLNDSEITGGKPLKLSRRAFLSFLFGYLTVAALVLFVVGSVATALYPLRSFDFPRASDVGNLTFVFVYVLLISNVAANSLLGIHYLAYRIHVKPRQVRRVPSTEIDPDERGS